MGRHHYVLMRRHHDIPIRRREDLPLRRLGVIPPRRCWVFHLRRTCDVTGTYRKTSLRVGPRSYLFQLPVTFIYHYILQVILVVSMFLLIQNI